MSLIERKIILTMEINELWEKVCVKLTDQVNDIVYNVWIEPLIPYDLINGNEMIIIAPSPLHRTVLMDQHISNKIETALYNTIGFEVTLKILINGEELPKASAAGTANPAVSAPVIPAANENKEASWQDEVRRYENKLNRDTDTPAPAAPAETAADTAPAQTAQGQMYSSSDESYYEYTFDTFIVGSSNRFAHAASVAVAENPGGAYNPLFIYGPSGMGKTHLLFAIQNSVLKKYPDKKVKYIKGDQFTNELIEAIGKGRQNEFHQKYRYIDVLMVDDVQFIGGKDQTQEEFFHTFNTLHQEHKQIVLTSDRPPREIQTLENRLRSRFEMGLLADIQPPEYETRIAIIKRKAKQCNMEISDEIAEFIAERLKSNIRQLEGVVKRINATYQLEKELPSLTMAQNAIRDVMNDVQPTPITIERIIEEVARTFEVTAKDIKSPKRAAQISQARQVAMYVVREVTNLSYEEIGKEFGRDHSTAIYAVQQVERNMKKRPDFRNMVNDLIKNIKVSAQ